MIYAIDSDSVRHAQARRWLEEILSGTEWVGLPWNVLLAFVRITARGGILRQPLPIESAVAFVDGWMAQPYVTLIGPGDNHWAVLRNLLLAEGTAGNLTSDAHLAALAIEHGCTVASTDHDFRRFAGVTVVNPISGQGARVGSPPRG